MGRHALSPALVARWPLRRLLGAVFLAFCLPLLAILGIAQYVDVSWQLRGSVDLQLRAAAIAGVERIWPQAVWRADVPGQRPPILFAPDGWDSRAEELARAVGSYTVLARVVTRDGEVLASRGGPREGPLPEIEADRIREAVQQYVGPYGTSHTAVASGNTWRILLVPMYSREQRRTTDYGPIAGLIVVGTPWRPYAHILAAMARDLLIVGLVLFGFATVMGRRLAVILSAPLERLAATAGRIGAGDLQARTGLAEGRSEIHAVGRELDAMAERIQGLVAAQQRFVEDASHELRTPLTILGGTADMLELGPDEEVRRRALQTITREVAKMQRLVDDLLLLARSEKTRLTFESVDLSVVVEDVREYGALLAGGRSLHVECPASLRLMGDAGQLERALRNLLDNAIRCTAEDGRVEMRVRAERGAVHIDVHDDGAGISAEDLPHVFDRFYRADASRTRRSGGSGLGLAIVRSVVEMHGGECGIESRPGAGTRVWIRLPAGEAPCGP